jgi:F-type H+-transporting ATPase subunit a
MFAGLTIMELVYGALGSVLAGIFRFGIPVPLHFFFDLFDGAIQTYVFMMLTMVFIKNALQHGEAHH